MEFPKDLTEWVITTLLTALTAVVGTVVALTRFIGNRCATELVDQKKLFIDRVAEMRIEIDELKEAVEVCQKGRFDLALQIRDLRHNGNLRGNSNLTDNK